MDKGGRKIVDGIDFAAGAGEFVSILGPNGAGKSTLLRLLAGLEKASAGSVHLGGRAVAKIERRELARQVALVEPMLDLPFALSVEQTVMMGRAPHSERWFETEADWVQVEQALRTMDCLAFRRRDFRSLSSGEKQRVLVASALAQQPCVLLLDEPAAFLDLAHQRDLFSALQGLAKEGYLVIAVTHDWNLAAAWASRLLLMKGGRLAADGTPSELARPELLSEVFSVDIDVVALPGQAPMIRHAL